LKKEIVGEKFGRLTVVSEAATRRSNGERNYNCVCECGKEKVVSGSNLKNGHTTSCGCARGKTGTAILSADNKGGAKSAKKNAGKATSKVKQAAGTFGGHTTEMVPIGTIGINRNIRRGMITPESDPKILELANSIKQIGILEPLIVNDTHSEDGKYQLIAGHRRLAAATIAECEDVPAIIYDNLDSRSALEIQISENLHRVDLSPTEIADVYVRMRDELGLPVDEIARRVGRSPAHVYQYIQLLTLPEAALKDIDSGDIGIAKALVLCTLPRNVIDSLLNNYKNVLYGSTAREFLPKIKDYFMKDLKGEKDFDINKEYTDDDGKVWPACTACPHKEQASLFDDIFDDNNCPDVDCYREKDSIAYDEISKAREKERAERLAASGVNNGGSWSNSYSDDDDDNEETEEERLQREEAAREYEARRQKQKDEENEKRKPQAIKSKEKAEYYLDRKLTGKFDAPDCFFYAYDDGDFESWYHVENEMLDMLYVKYTGKTFAEIKVGGTAEDIIKMALIYDVYNNLEYDKNELARWIGCELHPDDVDKDDKNDDDNDDNKGEGDE